MPKLLLLFSTLPEDMPAPEEPVTPDAVAERVVATLGGVTCVDSREWISEQGTRSGDTESMAWDTVLGREYGTTNTHFQGFVVCNEPLDAVNASIVRLALKHNRVVFALPDDGELVAVVGITAPGIEGPWTVKTIPIGA